jgi:ketosteroid isomerase-like protein
MDGGWAAFIAELEAAEAEFAQGRPEAFKDLWSHADDVTIFGAFGNAVTGWSNVGKRLDWASSAFTQGVRSRQEIHAHVGDGFAYLVQTESIGYRPAGGGEPKTLDMRVTMVFRREAGAWWIVHRHADPATKTQIF